MSYVIDTTAPVVTFTSPRPEGVIFDTDDMSSINWTVTDGVDGSGVASETVAFDGTAAAKGGTLDMFLLYPGIHTIVVTSADNLGNTGDTRATFIVRATAKSLISNFDRALAAGLITSKGTHASLRLKLNEASRAHEREMHATEHTILGAFVNELIAQSGKTIDPATADRFIAYARDLIANGG